MSAKHTPGPWTLAQNHQWPWTYRITGSNGNGVVSYDLWTHSTSDTQATANARPANAECAANARLIAAAPDLLAALQALVNTRSKHFIDNGIEGMFGWDERARAAIAKAEGGAS